MKAKNKAAKRTDESLLLDVWGLTGPMREGEFTEEQAIAIARRAEDLFHEAGRPVGEAWLQYLEQAVTEFEGA